ncbi:hypothetical protein GWI33_018178 [Rhynchophorus ferrugineus]|uniref:Uncharacterized protein n=1 Tax=Rhynchophorus ferrugineus TaxID=354439 RepID=A0A834HX02_RHYFE|nr:hypothetical protein GWI33_018178 [Rhynchophorus ferrugineus]
MPLRISCRASNNDKHEWDITYFLFHDGKLYSAADDGKIMIWSADLVKLNEVQAHPCSVYCLVIHKDTLWSCSNDGTIKSWDAETLKPIQTLVENDEVEYWQLAILDNCLVAGDDKGNISVYKGDKLYGQINLAEPVKAMIVSDNMIFTVRDLDLVITEIKTEGENVQYGVKKTFMGRAPVTLIGDKLFAYSTREGKEIVINENNIVNNFKYAARITKGSDLIINALGGVKWGEKEHLFSGGWDKILKHWLITHNSPENVASLELDIVITVIQCGKQDQIYVGGADGHILRIDIVP